MIFAAYEVLHILKLSLVTAGKLEHVAESATVPVPEQP